MDRDARPLHQGGGFGGYNFESNANPFGTSKRGAPPAGTASFPGGEQPSSSTAPAKKTRDPERPLKYNPSGAYDRVPDEFKMPVGGGSDGASPEEDIQQSLIPCPNCGRKFREDRLEKHAGICKNFSENQSRRGTFNVTGNGSPSLGGSFMSSSKNSSVASSPMKSSITSRGTASMSSPGGVGSRSPGANATRTATTTAGVTSSVGRR